MKKPFFSAVITAFNSESFIRDAIESVLKQSFDDFELIIVDNGSKDDTYPLVSSLLKNTKIKNKIIKKESNVGIGEGRNIGIRAAEGEYIAFLDSDDVWYKEKLKTSYNVIKKNPDADLVCNDEYLIVNGKKIGIMKYGPAKENMYQWLLTQGNCISGSASVVKKEKIVNAGMFSSNPNFEGVEDYELWIRLSKIGKFYFIDNILGEYRVGEHNTSKKVERQVEHEKNVIEHYLAQEEDKSMQEAKKRYAKIYFGAGWGLHRQGEFNECISWYKKAIKEDPLFYKSYFGLLLAATRIRW